jgi:hypothetical protein
LSNDSPFAITCDSTLENAMGWKCDWSQGFGAPSSKSGVHHVWGKEKLITPKLDKLLKHNNHHKCKVSMLKCLFEFNMGYVSNLFQGHRMCVTTIQRKGYFIFEWSSLLGSQKQFGNGHIIRIGSCASTKRHFAKVVCIFYLQNKKITKI